MQGSRGCLGSSPGKSSANEDFLKMSQSHNYVLTVRLEGVKFPGEMNGVEE